MSGLSTRASISLGWALVAGRKRVPNPAAGKTAFRICIYSDSSLDHGSEAEPSCPAEEMNGDRYVSLNPLAHRDAAAIVGIAFIRPIDEERLTDNGIAIHKSPVAAVIAVVAIVAHDKKTIRRHDHGAVVVAARIP